MVVVVSISESALRYAFRWFVPLTTTVGQEEEREEEEWIIII